MTNIPSPPLKQTFFGNNGQFLVGGLLYTYQGGTSTPTATYTATGALNTNPITLDSRGSCDLWLVPNTSYHLVLQDSAGNQIFSIDNIINAQLISLYAGVDTGIVNALILNFAANFTSLVDGIVLYLIPANSNTGATTVNVNGLGVVPLINQNGTPLNANELLAGQVATIMYKGGNWLLIQGAAQGIVSYGGNDTGTTNAYVVALPNQYFSYSAGNVLFFIPTNTNTGASTINVKGLGAVSIMTANGTALPAASLISGGLTEIVYTGSFFRLVTPTYIQSSFTGTLTGMTGTITGTINYTITGNVVTMRAPASITGTSNAGTLTVIGLPTITQPTAAVVVVYSSGIIDNSNVLSGEAQISGGVVTLAPFTTSAIANRVESNSTIFTASGTKGLNNGWTISYPLN